MERAQKKTVKLYPAVTYETQCLINVCHTSQIQQWNNAGPPSATIDNPNPAPDHTAMHVRVTPVLSAPQTTRHINPNFRLMFRV